MKKLSLLGIIGSILILFGVITGTVDNFHYIHLWPWWYCLYEIVILIYPLSLLVFFIALYKYSK